MNPDQVQAFMAYLQHMLDPAMRDDYRYDYPGTGAVGKSAQPWNEFVGNDPVRGKADPWMVNRWNIDPATSQQFPFYDGSNGPYR
jgi:hypothetical protein